MSAERPIESDKASQRVAAWIAGYAPSGDAPDELLDPDGCPRAHWLQFLESLAAFGDIGLEQRFAAAGRRIDDMGISYRVHGEAKERSWPLGRLPLLIPESEWRDIAAGVAQRAELLDQILHDVYGKARLVAEGALPAAAITGSPDFIRPMCGVAPPGGRWLRFYAADIGRGPDGAWRVLGDRAQAPSGAGYALENRMVLSRALPSLYRDMNVERLAPFFREFRASISGAAQRVDPRICLLTPGPWSETYSEQVNLARYLGLTLVEGEDLVMSDGKLHVRTIAGLKRADAIWRRVDADWCDPLEQNAASRLGVAGMFEAIRRGAVVVANMPGAGLIESRALLSFLPELSERALGEGLKLPNVATWWCGRESERDQVVNALSDYAISGAFSDRLPGFGECREALGHALSSEARARLIDAINQRGVDYVAQEQVKLSTTPAWSDGRLTPRPFALRVFAAATADGWTVMPGGFCRVSNRLNARAVSMDAGARSSDVWVLTSHPIEWSTLLPSDEDPPIVRALGNLPSRAADNLFWMGRYLERAEATLRVVRSLGARLGELQHIDLQGRQSIERLARLLIAWGAAPEDAPDMDPTQIAWSAAAGADDYGSALSVVRNARRAASIVRERLSQDVWQLIGRIETRLTRAGAAAITEPEALEIVERSLHTLAALSGLIDENFNRVAGWSFIDLGRRIERAIGTCRFARQFAGDDATVETLDALLDLLDSQITYRSRYIAGAALAPVLDMAMLDPFNPRSVLFQAMRIDEHLAALPTLRDDGVMEPPRRLSVKLRAELESEDARRLDAAIILGFEQRLMSLADKIAERYFTHGADGAANSQPSRIA
ncbi:circularly permuted type 2 ATP-grasp protein [Methylocystis sp.]|uniref:circularly permuted type 2 ATP-grasp protein n=1 Tax=Methylocystis sp. TaxID=1911079 RepID=UPI002732F578|nr:circularly permuted type 2 ATP-grasp protein [Methylocystis sp.]MDP3554269.1 circularly permuted type 2 ATP-grasp protein [Methylocystis sp.]